MTDEKFRLSEMTWEDVEDILNQCDPVVFLPVGSTEQHGPHLPLGTDSFCAVDVAEAAAAEIAGAVMAPPMKYGMSAHHMALAGTVTVRPEILLEYTYDVISSLSDHGFYRFVLVNGHRISNLPWMQLVSERVHRQLSGCRCLIFDLAYMSKEVSDELEFEFVGHADEIETSHMLSARPELCCMEKAEDQPTENDPLSAVDPRYTGDVLAYSPTPIEQVRKTVDKTGGVKGTPSQADAEKGEIYRRHLVNRLIEVAERMQS